MKDKIVKALNKLKKEKENFDKCLQSLTIKDLGDSFDEVKQIILHSKDIDISIKNLSDRIENKSSSLCKELQK